MGRIYAEVDAVAENIHKTDQERSQTGEPLVPKGTGTSISIIPETVTIFPVNNPPDKVGQKATSPIEKDLCPSEGSEN